MLDLQGYEAQSIQFGSAGPLVRWSRPDAPDLTTDFKRFYPINVGQSATSGEFLVNWYDVAGASIADGFYHQVLVKDGVISQDNCALQTSWGDLVDIAAADRSVPLRGSIFHAARSGSTLVHRMVNQVSSAFSLCEPALIGSLLSAGPAWEAIDRTAALPTVLRLLGRHPDERKTGYVIKFGDTLATVIHEIRTLLPAVPTLFIYRDPREILVSIIAGPTETIRSYMRDPTLGGHRLVRAELSGPGIEIDEAVARVVGAIYRSVAASAATCEGLSKLRIIDYATLPDCFESVIAPHFGMTLSAEDRVRARDVAQHYSKSRRPKPFVSDREDKLRLVTPRIIDLVERFVEPYAEEIRKLCVT